MNTFPVNVLLVWWDGKSWLEHTMYFPVNLKYKVEALDAVKAKKIGFRFDSRMKSLITVFVGRNSRSFPSTESVDVLKTKIGTWVLKP